MRRAETTSISDRVNRCLLYRYRTTTGKLQTLLPSTILIFQGYSVVRFKRSDTAAMRTREPIAATDKNEPVQMRLSMIAILLTVVGLSPSCEGQTLNSKVTTFLAGKVGARIGGGECAHAASEALRAAGAEFTNTDLGADSPAAGDYVWGTLVKSISIVSAKWTDSKPTTKLLPGDIIQYRNARFVYPTFSSTTTQHTSVVATVNIAGAPTFVYQQNFNQIRTLRKDSIDITKLVSGYLRIYRPKARIAQTGQSKFSLTNNRTATQSITLLVGTSNLGSFSLTSANTFASYQIRWLTLTGTTLPVRLRLSSGASVAVVNAGGYEIYTTSAGVAAIRRLTP